ncbi:MAG: hypothetical protein RL660_311 [Bacteroidota bacterium]|jgi:hypothetical protein
MVFVVAHYASANDFADLRAKYSAEMQDDDIVCCGTSAIAYNKDERLAYHPLFEVGDAMDMKLSHQYIDTMMRAIQIEAPSTVVFATPTKLDTPNVLKRIKEHCDIVDVLVVD